MAQMPASPRITPPSSQPVQLKTTPLKSNLGRFQHLLHDEDRSKRGLRIGSTMDNNWSTPVDPQKFLDTFLVTPDLQLRPPPFTVDLQKKWKKAATGLGDLSEKGIKAGYTEPKRYPALVQLLNETSTTLKFFDTSNKAQRTSWVSPSDVFQPDLTAFAHKDLSDNQDFVPNISLSEVFWEIKNQTFKDPWKKVVDPEEISADKAAAHAVETRDQITTYAGGVLGSQFRTHFFSVFLAGDQGRLIRWDREGATITEPFYVWEEPYLHEFLWRYDQADQETRGHDPNATRLDPEKDGKEIDRARAILDMGAGEAVHKFNVGGQVFAGGKIHVQADPVPTGRSTRGFLVTPWEEVAGTHWVPDTSQVIHFLKHAWRISELESEGAIYKWLHEKHVEHIPTILAYGDGVGGWQETNSKFFQVTNRRHYRNFFMVQKEVGRKLTSFKEQVELLRAVRDAEAAHEQAYENAKVLHRDISVGNILIYDKGGLLIDWEFSKRVDLPDKARIAERTGTWQFMSARLLQAPLDDPLVHTVIDDRESFFHVLCYVALQYVKHDYKDNLLPLLIHMIYGYHPDKKGSAGDHKANALRSKTLATEAFVGDHIGPIRDFIAIVEGELSLSYNAKTITNNSTPPPELPVEVFQEGWGQIVTDSKVLLWIRFLTSHGINTGDWSAPAVEAAIKEWKKRGGPGNLKMKRWMGKLLDHTVSLLEDPSQPDRSRYDNLELKKYFSGSYDALKSQRLESNKRTREGMLISSRHSAREIDASAARSSLSRKDSDVEQPGSEIEEGPDAKRVRRSQRLKGGKKSTSG
ncbi:hypothetical protein V5O48_014383 [Marasmius crinis-equi]|uniref:Fungal-type protein kinase domain-containing protein n=1 Tax=Marasmius crinis-equi TaxID=585013 RepID=A0ABR3EXH8_9AGAR